MADHKESTPEMSRARIAAIKDTARQLSIRTGGDQAECAFEMVCAAVLIINEARPIKAPAKIIAGIAADAEATVEQWFAEELKRFRCRHG